jgi:hypothetical protein
MYIYIIIYQVLQVFKKDDVEEQNSENIKISLYLLIVNEIV